MAPLVERLESEESVRIARLEVWHNEVNASRMRELDKGYCGGVPFFFNKKTGKWICGEADYERLKQWGIE